MDHSDLRTVKCLLSRLINSNNNNNLFLNLAEVEVSSTINIKSLLYCAQISIFFAKSHTYV